jgi:hypothetical protein
MRLTLTLPELEQGWSIQGGPSERVLDLKMLAHRRDPVAVVPVSDHDHRIISVVRLIDDAIESTSNSLRIKFKPVWCKTFTLCAAKKDSILALICEFDEGQYWINRDGWRPCNLTLNGPGTDPKTVHNSQFVMGELLANWPRPDIVFNAIQLIQEKFP